MQDVFDFKKHEEEIKKYEEQCNAIKIKRKINVAPFDYKKYARTMKNMDQKEMIYGRLMDWVLNTVSLVGFLACAWSLALALFFNCSTYTILFLALLALTGFYFRENFQTLSGPGGRFYNYLKTEYEILTGSVPTVMKTASEICQEQLDFATDDFYLDLKMVGGIPPTSITKSK